jgi:hypothetical protein
MNSPLGELSAKQLRQAADLKDRIDTLQAELDRLLGTAAPAGAARGRKRSPLAIARMRRAAKARWARRRGAAPEKTAQPRSRRISAAGRARISAAAKARWAAVRAKGQSRL